MFGLEANFSYKSIIHVIPKILDLLQENCRAYPWQFRSLWSVCQSWHRGISMHCGPACFSMIWECGVCYSLASRCMMSEGEDASCARHGVWGHHCILRFCGFAWWQGAGHGAVWQVFCSKIQLLTGQGQHMLHVLPEKGHPKSTSVGAKAWIIIWNHMKDPEGLVLLLVDFEVEFLAMVVEVSVPHLKPDSVSLAPHQLLQSWRSKETALSLIEADAFALRYLSPELHSDREALSTSPK